MMKRLFLLFGLIFSNQALAADDPDALYRQGRFDEAEKAYVQLDMDHPKDIRYRYNRGCTAFQKADYQTAKAAFSSVLRRAKDNDTRFKTAYNLGNTAFNLGDFVSAIAYYKQAIRYNPACEDARYNLELSLMALEKGEKNRDDESDTPPQKDACQGEKDKGQPTEGKEGDDPDAPSQDRSDQQPSQGVGQKDSKGHTASGQDGINEEKKTTRSDGGQKAGQTSPKDLSGELKPLQALSPQETQGGDPASGRQTMSMIDKKRAEALLDNIKEDRSRFLRSQVSGDKKHGVPSGKDW